MGGVIAPVQDRQRAGILVPSGRIGSRGSSPGERCGYLLGGDGGCRPINIWAAGRFGNAHWADSCASLDGWAELAVCSCGSSATCGGSYLATPPTFTSSWSATTHNVSCGSTAACGSSCGSAAAYACTCVSPAACSRIPFDACGYSCGQLASPRHSCGFLAAPSPNSSCSYTATPSCSCSQSATCSCPCGYLTLLPIPACSLFSWAYPP